MERVHAENVFIRQRCRRRLGSSRRGGSRRFRKAEGKDVLRRGRRLSKFGGADPAHPSIDSADLGIARSAVQDFDFLAAAQLTQLFKSFGRFVDQQIGVVGAALHIACGIRASRRCRYEKAEDKDSSFHPVPQVPEPVKGGCSWIHKKTAVETILSELSYPTNSTLSQTGLES